MKNKLAIPFKSFAVIALLLFSLHSNAQTTKSFDDGAIISRGKVQLKSGEVKSGVVAFYLSGKAIMLFSDTSTFYTFNRILYHKKSEYQTIKIEDIKDVKTTEKGHYWVKYAKGNITSLSEKLTFLKLVSDNSGKVKIYERYSEENPSNYYISFNDSEEEAYSVDASKFKPNFSKKLSVIFSDCPELAKKIADKAEGYGPPESPKLSLGVLKKAITDGVKTNSSDIVIGKVYDSIVMWKNIIYEYNNTCGNKN